MASMKDLYKSADWKKEKHVPVIDAPGTVQKGKLFNVNVGVGKEVSHPNTTAHHIRWIRVYFHPAGEKFPYHIVTAEFASHGESSEGADTSTVYTHPECTLSFKTEKPGTILATSYCNIHGLWEGSREVQVS
jgi:superoxide reductase